MTNDQFLNECKFIANEVMRFKHDDLDNSIDKAIWVLKAKRTEQVKKKSCGIDESAFNHYAKQYKPLVRWMVIALDNKENFK
jgi:hypothetical protein